MNFKRLTPKHSSATILILVALLTLVGCQVETPEVSITEAPSTPILTPEQLLLNAYNEPDPTARRAAAKTAAADFLRYEAIREMDDETAGEIFTAAARGSGQLLLPDPALIARQGEVVIISLPDAMGLHLYDLRRNDAGPTLELSAWNLGLNALRATWGDDEVGVSYVTIGNDAIPRVHYVLAKRVVGGWEIAWRGEDEPVWWFNNAHATLQVAEDLEHLIVTGLTEETSFAFDPGVEGALQRTFKLVWQRTEEGYEPEPGPQDYQDRQHWVWAAAELTPYATLVEFTERLVLGEFEGARALTTGEAAFNNGIAFGMQLEGRYYHIVTRNEVNHTITFKDTQGTFVASFVPSANEGERWLINSVLPIGAVQPTATPGN